MKHTNKKGFTLLELVVVIAVIAILAAVLIPTFSRILSNSKVSNDNQLIRNLNTALSTDSVLSGSHPTMTSALKAAAAAGYDVGKINKSATDNEILWDSKNDVFCYFNADSKATSEIGKIEYIPETTLKYQKNEGNTYDPTKVNLVDYWVIAAEPSSTYSTYLFGYVDADLTELKTGLDVGTTENVNEITYVGGTSPQEVVIRTNSYRTVLSVDAPHDVVRHYDQAGKVNVISTDNASYHENGDVPYIKVSGGHLVLEATAEITAVHFVATNGEFKNEDEKTISLDISNLPAEKYPSFSRDDVEIDDAGTFVAKVTSETDEYIWLWGNGTQVEMVVSENDEAIAQKVDDTYELKNELTAGVEEGTIAYQIANEARTETDPDTLEQTTVYVPRTSAEEIEDSMEVIIREKIVEEDRAKAAESGICLHEYELAEYLENSEPTCLEGGMGKFVCSICGDTKYDQVAPLGHDLIGVYCNRCHHPVAFVDQIKDFTMNDPQQKKMPVIIDIVNEGIFSGDYAGELYLDVAYSFKAFPAKEGDAVLNDTTTYSFDAETASFYADPEGLYTAQAIYNFFSGWLCDYYVSFDEDVEAFSCGLGGYYESWGVGVGFLAPVAVPADYEIPLLGTMISGGQSNWTYDDIVRMVGEFKCGFFNLSDENVKTTFTVKLRMIRPENAPSSFGGVELPDYIDVAVTNYEITAPSAENAAFYQYVTSMQNQENG